MSNIGIDPAPSSIKRYHLDCNGHRNQSEGALAASGTDCWCRILGQWNRLVREWPCGQASPQGLMFTGAGDGSRTHDLSFTKAVLYQLSYASPIWCRWGRRKKDSDIGAGRQSSLPFQGGTIGCETQGGAR